MMTRLSGMGPRIRGQFGAKPDSSGHEREIESESDETEINNPVIIVDEPSSESEIIDPPSNVFKVFFNNFNNYKKPWYEGPNSCLTVENIGETDHVNNSRTGKNILFKFDGSFSSSEMYARSCSQNDEEFVCKIQEITDGVKKTRIEKRRCCYGYKRALPDGYCKEIDLKDLVQTLREVGCEAFYNMSVSASLGPMLRNQNLTIFCPNDEAMESLQEETNSIEINEVPLARKRRQVKDGLAYNLENHMVSGFVRSADFIDENVLMTVNNETGIRTNVYRVPQTILTANCARVTSSNKFATNGIIHLIDRVIKPVRDTIADIITKKSDFSILKKLISITGLLSVLRDQSSHITLFAPTDSAFKKSGVDIDSLQASGCLDKLLKNHILTNVICSTAINRRVRAQNMLGEALSLHRDPDDQKLYIGNNVQVTARDLVGTNGVVHVIDDLVIPTEAQKLMEALSEVGYDSLVNALNRTSLISTLENESNFTFIVPHRKAFENLPDNVTQDDDKMKEILLYHVVEQGKDLRNLKNNAIVTAKNGKPIRVNRYQLGFVPTMTAQCVPMPSQTLQICSGSLQSLNGIMKPAEGKLLDVLSKEEKYSIVKKIVNAANLSEILNSDGPYTVLVPTDKVIKNSLSEEDINTITKDNEAASNFISKYILPGIRNDPIGFFHNSLRTIDNHRHPITRDYVNDIPKIGGLKLIKCDNVAENGVIHEIDGFDSVHKYLDSSGQPTRLPSQEIVSHDITVISHVTHMRDITKSYELANQCLSDIRSDSSAGNVTLNDTQTDDTATNPEPQKRKMVKKRQFSSSDEMDPEDINLETFRVVNELKVNQKHMQDDIDKLKLALVMTLRITSAVLHTIPNRPKEFHDKIIRREFVRTSGANMEAIELAQGASYPVTICCIESPSLFYCQMRDNLTNLDIMSENLNNVYNAAVSDDQFNLVPRGSKGAMNVGKLCCARYQVDGLWYRAKIVTLYDKEFVELLFVDYGNLEKAVISSLKILQPEFNLFPAQAIKCCLRNSVPLSDTWSSDASNYFADLTEEVDLVAKFHNMLENNFYEVDLFNVEKEVDVAKAMIAENYSKPTLNFAVPAVPDTNPYNMTYMEMDIQNGHQCKVIVPWIKNIGEITVIILEKYYDIFLKMMNEIQKFYGKVGKNEDMITNPTIGQPCIALFKQDSAWYRAQIKELYDVSVQVRFVDYGNEEVVHKSKLRKIHPNFMGIPAQAVFCKLRSVVPPYGCNWPPTSKHILDNYFDGTLDCKFVINGECYEVELRKDNQNIAEEVVKNGHAKFGKITTTMVQPPKQLQSPSSQITSSRLPTEITSTVVLLHLESLNEIYVVKGEDELNLDALHEKLQSVYYDMTSNLGEVVEGECYVAQYSEDNMWYRVIVVKMEDSAIHVRFIDYGNSGLTTLDRIRPLLPEFANTPTFSVCVSLGMKLPNTEEIKQVVKELLQDMDIMVKVISQGPPCVVRMTVGDIDSSILRMIFGTEQLLKKLMGITSAFRFLDYGNLEITTLDKIRSLLPEFENTPPFSICVSLGMKLPDTEDVKSGLKDLLEDSSIITKVTSQGPPYVVKMTVEGVDVCQALLAKIKPSQADNSEIEKVVKSSVEILHRNLPDEIEFTVICVHLESLNQIYVVKIADEQELAEFYEKIQDTDIESTSDIRKVIQGESYMVKYSEDDMWYRAVVEKIDGNTIYVHFIDYGNFEYTSIDRMRAIQPEFQTTPAFCICVSLNVPQHPDELKNEIKELMRDVDIVTKVVSREGLQYSVIMSVDCTNINEFISSKLTESTYSDLKEPQDHITVTVGEIDVHQEISKLTKSDESSIDIDITQISTENSIISTITNRELDLGTTSHAIIYSNDSPSSFYVVLQEDKDTQEEFIKELQKINYDIQKLVENPLISHYYLVFDCKNKQWNRAHVISVSGPIVYIKNNKVMVILKTIQDLNVNDAIIDHGFARKVTEVYVNNELLESFYLKSMTLFSDVSYVILQHVQSLEEFYVILIQSLDSLKRLFQNLQVVYSDTVQYSVQKVDPSKAYAVKSNGDNMWYRAKIVSMVDDDITVQFFDYGNTEKISITNMKSLLPEFKEIDAFAIKCKLNDDLTNDEKEKLLGLERNMIMVHVVKQIEDIYVVDIKLLNISEPLADSSKINYFKQLEITPETTEEVTISYAASTDNFYVQLNKHAKQFLVLMNEIDDLYSSATPDKCLQEDAACVIQFVEDEAWYRAKIDAVNLSDNTVEVIFIDYGNSASVQSEECFQIYEHLLQFPVQAIPCRLYTGDIIPNCSEDTDKFLELVEDTDKKFLAKFVEFSNNRWSVSLIDGNIDVLESISISNVSPVHESELVSNPIKLSHDEKIVPGQISNINLSENDDDEKIVPVQISNLNLSENDDDDEGKLFLDKHLI
ncbi:Transforming growth factor-beta-induced protein ig-h3 [Nymphon striatum]|nr:Transforming growth factor-beta-induced protein ig-h3 [Nymphon striatum]